MKSRQKGSISFIIGGILALVSTLGSSGDAVIPEQIKILGGFALIVFGLSRLFFQYDDTEEQKKNRKIVLLFMSLLTVGAVGYFYFQRFEPGKKQFAKLYGSFEVKLGDKTCLGNAMFEKDTLTLQIKSIPKNIKINGFKLYRGNIQIGDQSIKWICALRTNRTIVHCSTGLDLPKENFDHFVDNGTYTISYSLREPLENIKISDISFTVLTDQGEENVKIADKK